METERSILPAIRTQWQRFSGYPDTASTYYGDDTTSDSKKLIELVVLPTGDNHWRILQPWKQQGIGKDL